MEGTWFDRTQEYGARDRGEDVAPDRFATREILELDPLPCWKHVSPEQHRQRIAGLVEVIVSEAQARRPPPPPSP